ncbi:MAG: hypothetical protein REI78_02980 [Pedobacter sp.]|nr:hypothetical protein [Pedobacter sp.]
MEIDEQYLKNEIEDFKGAFCPYGFLDIQFAVTESINAGHGGDWAFEQIEAFSNECDIKFSNLDPCSVVMDSILQEARNEIEELTGFDVQNDASFDVYGNFMASSWKFDDEDVLLLVDKLKEQINKVDDFSKATIYWLSEIGINNTSFTGGE